MKKHNLITRTIMVLVSLLLLSAVLMAAMESPSALIVPFLFALIVFLVTRGSARLLIGQRGVVSESDGVVLNPFVFDALLADDDYYTAPGTLISGQVLTRGALLGLITASGKYTLSLSAAVDGSQTPIAILAKDTDATAGDTLVDVYVFGNFNTNGMTFGTGQTATGVAAGLRTLGIFLSTSMNTTGQQ